MANHLSDASARQHAVDPMNNVVLEASAGTGKTRVLVERYVNLLRAGIDPDHVLAITFTRKAAAEMRDRIIDRLREASRLSEIDLATWRNVKDRLGDIAISTIDAFCLSLLREFPLEADVDPGFDLADETEVPRLLAESLDQAFRICRAIAADDDDVALLFAQLGERRLRTGIAALVNRRLVAPQALRRYLERGPRDLTAALACSRAAARLCDALSTVPGGLEPFLLDGPIQHRQFGMLADDVRRLCDLDLATAFENTQQQADFRHLVDRLRAYFLTQDGRPRGEKFTGTGFTAEHCGTDAQWRRHRSAAASLSPVVAETIRAFRRDLNIVMSRGVWRVFAVALRQYQQTLESRALLDFSGVLERALKLLRDMDEFAQSRYRIESRYRHVLLDEFQDTSRAQWELVALLIKDWGEGSGASSDALAPTIFLVGDRKQSIYGFRDAEVAVLDAAAAFVEALRAEGDPRRAISVSFRAVPELLAFVNDLFNAVDKTPDRPDAFRYDERDRFPGPAESREPRAEGPEPRAQSPEPRAESLDPEVGQLSLVLNDSEDDAAIGLIVDETVKATADRVAGEIVRLLANATVRDRTTGIRRRAQPADIAILFRSRDSHREFEKALERRGVSTYVYKGLGFFEADEVQDAVALLRYLADPDSDLRAAALLRSRLVRLSDRALAVLAPCGVAAVVSGKTAPELGMLSDEDRRVLERLCEAVPTWLRWVDRLAPSELLSAVLSDAAYAFEIRGGSYPQARENLKKLHSMVRRFQNRGFATLARVTEHLDELAVGDESNASIDAREAVSLMTVHAAKGLEFPIVFVVNLGRGTGGIRPPIRVANDGAGEPAVAIADYQSEADEDAVARDREETKRLLYVALTRARDRLYLSMTAQDGTPRMGRGSLGDVLPPAVKDLLKSAGSIGVARTLAWNTLAHRHLFAVPGR